MLCHDVNRHEQSNSATAKAALVPLSSYLPIINQWIPKLYTHIQPHAHIQQLLFSGEKHNVSHKVKGSLHATNVRFTNPDPVKWTHVCVCADDDTTTEFSLLWLSDVKAGVYKACSDLSVKHWGAWRLSSYKSIRSTNAYSLISFFGKEALKILAHKHAFKSHRKSGLESAQSLRLVFISLDIYFPVSC